MAGFNTEKLLFYINAYQKELPTFWEDEKYKWEAVQCFQDNWNIESEDFGQMLKTATRKHLNLLGSGNYFPLGMLQEFIGIDKERVRNMFRSLYDERRDVVERISAYQAEAEQIRLISPEKWRNHYQDLRAISVLLWLRYPNKYYIYKYKELNRTLKLIDSDFSTKDSSNPAFYKSFLELMNYLCSIISKNKNLEQTLRSLLDGNPDLFPDNNLHITTVDFVFYVGKRYQQVNTKLHQEPSNNMNMTIKEQFRIYLANCVKTNRSTDNSFIIGKTTVDSYVSFAEVDKLFDYAPEQWKSISSIYDITSPQSILGIIEILSNDDAFKTRDSNESSQYFRSNAIKQYYCFLKARELFGNYNKSNIISTKFDLTLHPLQQIFYGAPGTGKSHRIKEIIQEHGIDEKKQVIRTTFHPDSDYSTFVGCYKPIMKAVPQTYVVEGKEKPVIDIATSQQSQKDEIVYDYTPQAFVQAYTKAWANPGKPIILVIEEINRGNCAQIFGDIFQLLDRGDDGVSDYEIKPDKALEDYLKGFFAGKDDVPEDIRNGEIMKLPANLYIWATMNTSDQSLFPIDSAFKRRWEWKYIKIAWPYKKNEDCTFKTDGNGDRVHFNYSIEGGHDWWKFLQQINAIIDKMTNSADKQLGYFFAKAKDDVISYDTFVSKVCFYLWNDIFKTYALDEQQGDLFSYIDKEGKKKQLTFPAFYDGDGNVIKEVAEAFIGNVMRWNSDTKNDNI